MPRLVLGPLLRSGDRGTHVLATAVPGRSKLYPRGQRRRKSRSSDLARIREPDLSKVYPGWKLTIVRDLPAAKAKEKASEDVPSDLAILIDDSLSMGVRDVYRDVLAESGQKSWAP